MYKTISFITLLTIYTNCAFSQFSLNIEIKGFRNCEGEVLLQLFDSSHSVVAVEKKIIVNNNCIIDFPGLTAGKYAVRCFHDENCSGELDTNAFGKPTEGYSFSNNAAEMFGPPSFNKWLFEITGNKKIVLDIIY